MLKKNQKKVVKQKFNQPKFGSPKNEQRALLMRLRGTAPLMHVRQKAFEKAIKNRTMEITIAVRAGERALMSMVYETGFLDRQTKNKIRQIIERLLRDKKIFFDGKTRVDFSKTETTLQKFLGKNLAKQFKQYFKGYLQDETNFARSYLKTRNAKIIMEQKW